LIAVLPADVNIKFANVKVTKTISSPVSLSALQQGHIYYFYSVVITSATAKSYSGMKLFFIILLLTISCIQLSAQKTIQFSGLTWNVRSGGGGPGPNLWSDSQSNVWVDSEGLLHLKIRKVGNTWYCSEVYLQKSFGYGEYRFYVASDVEKYDPLVVVGLFTYETDTREIDIEFSRWGDTANPAGWYTIQPVVPGNQHSFSLDLQGDSSTHKFNWSAGSIFFESYFGYHSTLPSAEKLISSWTYTGNYIPPTGNERLHINFWLMGGKPPSNGEEAELVIKAVAVPMAGSVSENETENGLTLYPNPCSNLLNIRLKDGYEKSVVTILATDGTEKLRYETCGSEVSLDISQLSSGVYFVKLITNKCTVVQKLIKK